MACRAMRVCVVRSAQVTSFETAGETGTSQTFHEELARRLGELEVSATGYLHSFLSQYMWHTRWP